MLNVLSWNLRNRPAAWRSVFENNVDVALLQEACAPPADFASRVGDDAAWSTEGAGTSRAWRTCVVALNSRIDLQRHVTKPIRDACAGELGVSRLGTIAAADVRDPDTGEILTVISMYAPWERPHPSVASEFIYADASAHRAVSDISAFVDQRPRHRIVAAGDLNILFGYGEDGNPYWAGRYRTVFERMTAIGFRFVGPQFPHGQRAEPWPKELPKDSLNVPTFRRRLNDPATATRQLDFVFASECIADRVNVRAANDPVEWGPSDHCRILIEIGSEQPKAQPSRPTADSTPTFHRD